jgi:hypothetical protein
MKKRCKNLHAGALGRLGGLVRREAKGGPTARMATRATRSKAARRELPRDATQDAHVRGEAERRGERGAYLDSRAFRISCDRSGLWRNPLFRTRTLLNGIFEWTSIEGRRQEVQLSFLCPWGKRIALKTLGCRRSCYDRRHHSLRFSADCRSGFCSATASAAAVVVARGRPSWSIIATGATRRICW